MKGSFNINSKSILTALICTVVVMIFVSLFTSEKVESNVYAESIEAFRKEKDIYLKNDKKSPLEDKEKFDKLNYYEPDPAFRVKASLELINDDDAILKIDRSDGKKEDFAKYAYASFYLEEKLHKVLLLKRINNRVDTTLRFLPFYDKTNGDETYGGGRYLDLHYLNDQEIEIDFNLAYNPFCVYNIRYSCPLPPQENFIDAEIRAGEKNYKAYE